jgi:hypothetical protein
MSTSARKIGVMLVLFFAGEQVRGDVPLLRVVEDASGISVVVTQDGRVVGYPPLGEGESNEAGVSPPQLPGWPLFAQEVDSTPRVGDVDGDGRLDVVFGSDDDHLYAVDLTGAFLPGWPISEGRSLRTASLADIDGDGRLEVFMAAGGALRGLRFDGGVLEGWPQPFGTGTDPAIDDLEGDGILEIADVQRYMALHLWGSDGSERSGWPILLPQMANKGPATGDVDGDGIYEVVFPMSSDPSLYVLSPGAELLDGFPLSLTVFGLKEGVSLADLDANGSQEIIFLQSQPIGTWVVSGNGVPVLGWPVALQRDLANSPPAVGDLDGDGHLEIVWGTIGGDAQVFALHDDGTLVDGWPVTVPSASFNAQPTIGDVDGDGGPDVVLAGLGAGRIHAWRADGSVAEGFPVPIPVPGQQVLASAVTITDLDQDGDVDLLVGTVAGFGGTGPGAVFAFDLPAPYDPSTMHWPTKAHDIRHTSRYEPPNRSPVPDAGTDRFVECASPAGAAVLLDGSASFDPDSTPGRDQIASHVWFLDRGTPSEQRLGHGKTLAVDLPRGRHEVTLRVADSYGAFATDTMTVEVIDSVPPELSVTVDPAELWPPNHRMVEVSVAVAASDACDPAPAVRLVSVTSSEADDALGPGDGETEGDIAGGDLGTADEALWLRAERSGDGPGRTYELRYEAMDAAGNVTPALAVVRVPHDPGNRAAEADLRVEQDPVTGNLLLLWPPVLGSSGYDAIRGEGSQVTIQASSVRLGPVTVLAREIGATALHLEEDAIPPPGEVAFYLLQSRSPSGRSGYGLESVPWPRVPSSCAGGCP